VTRAHSGDNSKAIRSFEKGLKEAPKNPQLLYNLALSLKTAGKTGKALSRAAEIQRYKDSRRAQETP